MNLFKSTLNCTRRAIRGRRQKVAERYINQVNRAEHENPPFTIANERPIEYRFVFEQIGAYYPRKILDVGTGVTALPHLMANCGMRVSAIDNIEDYWPAGLFNRHFFVENDDIVTTKLNDQFDMVTCVSTLEHIDEFDLAVESMFGLLYMGGHFVLTCPYTEAHYIDNVYALPGSCCKDLPTYKTRSFSRVNIDKWCTSNHARIIKQEYWRFFDGDAWTIGERLPVPERVEKGDRHQISCILFEK